MDVQPQTLPSLDTDQWGVLYEFRWRSTSGDYEIYGLWQLSTGNFLSVDYDIRVDTTTNTWEDSGGNVPTVVTEQSDGTVLLSDPPGVSNYYRFTKPITSSWIDGTSSESTSTAVASLGTSSGGVLKMLIPASSTGGSYSVFEGSTLKQLTTHVVTVADLVTITSWSIGNSSIWHVYFNGSIINTWPAAISSSSTTKKVHCNFW